jgi:predicted DNA-binding protein (UPF0251 family)
MPRPKIPRWVSAYPSLKTFHPNGVPVTGEIELSVEGMEALRLSDFEGLDQASAARLMGISRQTYGRILGEARHIVATALVTGKMLRVAGGSYTHRGRGGRRRRRRGGRSE